MFFKQDIGASFDVACFSQDLGSTSDPLVPVKPDAFSWSLSPLTSLGFMNIQCFWGWGKTLTWKGLQLADLVGYACFQKTHGLSQVNDPIQTCHAVVAFSWYIGISSFLDLSGFFSKRLISPLNTYHIVLYLQRNSIAVSKASAKPLYHLKM